jgi:hypothetical protein
MSVIREALARRQAGGGGAPGGGGTMPAAGQQSQPGALTPTGNPNTPGQPTPQPPIGTVPGGMPQGAPQGQPQPQQPKPQPNFDDQTKSVGKALIAQLLKYI